MAQNLVKENKGNIQVSGYGKIRLMYTENCPVGEGCIGCSICKNQENGFALRDRKNMKFPIVCHPETCTAEILNSNMLCAPGEVRKIAEICDTRVRLIFTGENITQRKSITECFKKLLSDNSSESEVLQITEKIRKTAEAIALEQGGSLTRGHYRRGAN